MHVFNPSPGAMAGCDPHGVEGAVVGARYVSTLTRRAMAGATLNLQARCGAKIGDHRQPHPARWPGATTGIPTQSQRHLVSVSTLTRRDGRVRPGILVVHAFASDRLSTLTGAMAGCDGWRHIERSVKTRRCFNPPPARWPVRQATGEPKHARPLFQPRSDGRCDCSGGDG